MSLSFYRDFTQPILFALDPERAHELVVNSLDRLSGFPAATRLLSAFYGYKHPALWVEVAGLKFPNPVGIAAGFDKDCRLSAVLPSLGFGFIEVGTVTPRPQPGNAKPRVFRIKESRAVINRLGFNSRGMDYAVKRLKSAGRPAVPIGINLGVNADTPADKAVQDYVDGLAAFYPYGDYFVLNVSSPNTQGLQELQDRLKLERILTALRPFNPQRKPIFVKLSADLTTQQLIGLVPLLMEEASGVIVCNTTQTRQGVPERYADLRGGLSGEPLRSRSTEMIAEVYRMSRGKLPIIGVGGVFSAQDAYQKIRAGASLVQVYTGLIFEGPGLVREINEGLVRILEGHNLGKVSDAIGLSHGIHA